MKKIVMALLLLGSISLQANACDICGCGVSNSNPFLFPYLSRNYLGLSYLHRKYYIHDVDGMKNTEYYNSLVLMGQFNVNKKMQLVATVPFQQFRLLSDEGNKKLSGLGDLSIAMNYKLFDLKRRSIRQMFVLGGAVKLPTGAYRAAGEVKSDQQNFQLGTGSVDFQLNSVYRASYGRWALSTTGSFKYNMRNKDGYRFGNILSANAMVVYKIPFKQFSISPYVQINKERQRDNVDNHVIDADSHGSIVYTGAGADISTRKISFGVNYQFAARQDLALGMIDARPKFVASVSYIF